MPVFCCDKQQSFWLTKDREDFPPKTVWLQSVGLQDCGWLTVKRLTAGLWIWLVNSHAPRSGAAAWLDDRQEGRGADEIVQIKSVAEFKVHHKIK